MLTEQSAFVAAVVVAVFDEERVLALRRAATKDAAPGLWECVSGRVAIDEDPLAAAEREVREETGLDVAIVPRPVDAYTARRNESPMLVVCYRADVIGGELTISDEHDAHEWLTTEAFAERTTAKRLAEAVARAHVL